MVGQAAVAGGAVLGLGALCYYGLGLSMEPGALEKSMWVFYKNDISCKPFYSVFYWKLFYFLA